MRRFFPLLLALLLAVSLAVPASAEEDDGSPSPDTSSSDASASPSSGNSEAASDSSANNSSDAVEESPANTSPDADTPDTAVSADTTTSDEGSVTVNVTIQQAETSGDEAAPEDTASSPEDIPAFMPDDSEDAAAYRTFTVVSPNDDETVPFPDGSSAMADVVVSVLGEYRRKTQTVTEMDSEGNVLATSTEIVPGLAGLDYEWIAGAVLFALFLFSLMKLIGGLLKL